MKKELPISINNKVKREQLSQQANHFIEWVNSELRLTFEAEGLIYDLATVEKYSDINVLIKFIETEKNKQLKSGFIPIETKQSIIRSFDAVLERIVPVMEQYASYKKAYPISLIQSGKMIRFDESELNLWLDDCTIYTFDDTDRVYYELLLKVGSVIDEVRAFEKENNIPSYVSESTQTLVSMAENIPSRIHPCGFVNDYKNNNPIHEKIARLRGFVL